MFVVKRKNIYGQAMSALLLALALCSVVSWAARANASPQRAHTTIDATNAVVETVNVAASQPTMALSYVRDELLKALPAQVKPVFFSELTKIYAQAGMQPLWRDRQAQQQFQQQLGELALAGVNPQFRLWANLLAQPDLTYLARDVILSDAFLGYLHYVNGVNAHGNRWLYHSGTYKVAAPTATVIEQWQQAIQQDELRGYVHRLAPQNVHYEKMRDALKSMITRALPVDAWPQLPAAKKSLRPGESRRDVPVLKDILVHNGLLTENQAVLPSNEALIANAGANVYSSEMVEAVKRFQQLYGLDNDGVVGSSTREALNMAPQVRVAVLALNIQRLRLLPPNYEHGIYVNIPDYSMAYYVDGKAVLESKVIVGSVKRKTPLMSSALDNVVVNPPWNVPAKLVREDIAPRIKRDPDYLKKRGYTVYDGWGRGAQELDPSEIDWSESNNYRVKQAPGSSNALGRFKFNMPNNDAIYLHDTPSRGLFNRTMRALSSGCVRVSKAAELADMLLNEAGWNDKKIKSALKQGDTRYVNIRQRIPVQLYYMTAWISAEGRLEFRNDIYGYDSAAKEGIKAIQQAEKLL